MHRTITRILGASALALALATVTGTTADAADSGFLKDYSKLHAAKDSNGVERRMWVDASANRKNYRSLILEPVVFYPTPEATDQFPLQTLNEIRDYLDQTLRKAVGATIPLTDKPGPGVMRLRAAITAASVDKSLKPYQMVPVALVFTAAKHTTGKAEYDVVLAAEWEATDSASGKLLGELVRTVQGVTVKGDQPVTLAMAKQQIDQWGEVLRATIVERFGERATQ